MYLKSYPKSLRAIPPNKRKEPDIRYERGELEFSSESYRWFTEGEIFVQLLESAGKHLHSEDQWFEAWKAFMSQDIATIIDRYKDELKTWSGVTLTHYPKYNKAWAFTFGWSNKVGGLTLFHINPPNYEYDEKRLSLY